MTKWSGKEQWWEYDHKGGEEEWLRFLRKLLATLCADNSTSAVVETNGKMLASKDLAKEQQDRK